jgi:hypothetical protein
LSLICYCILTLAISAQANMERIPTFLIHVPCRRPLSRSWAIRQPPRLEGPEQHDLVDTTCFKGTLVGDIVGPVHRQREILIHGWRFQAALVPIPWKKVEYVDGYRYRTLGWFLFEAEHEQFEDCKCFSQFQSLPIKFFHGYTAGGKLSSSWTRSYAQGLRSSPCEGPAVNYAQ